VEFPASRTEEDFSAFDADFSRVSRQSATKPGQISSNAAYALPAAVGQSGAGKGLSISARPKRMEGDQPLPLGKLQPFGEQASGLVTLTYGKDRRDRAKKTPGRPWKLMTNLSAGPTAASVPHEVCKRSDIGG